MNKYTNSILKKSHAKESNIYNICNIDWYNIYRM